MKRPLLIALAIVLALVLIPVVGLLIFLNNAEWQRSLVLDQLNAQPGMHAEVRYLKGGLGGVEIDDLFILSHDTAIYIDDAVLSFDALAALGKALKVSKADVNGLRLAPGLTDAAQLKQLFPEAKGTYQPQAAPSAPEVVASTPGDFNGILEATRALGYKVTVERLEADGRVILPSQGELDFNATGGSIAPGAEGNVRLTVNGRLAQAVNGYNQLAEQLDLRLTQRAEGGFSRVELKQTTKLEGALVETVTLLTEGMLRADEDREVYQLNLRAEGTPQPLVQVDAHWEQGTQRVQGTLLTNLDSSRTEAVGALIAPHRARLGGESSFDLDLSPDGIRNVTARFEGMANLESGEGLPLRKDVALELNLALEAKAGPTGIQAPQVQLSLRQQGGAQLVQIRNVQPILLDSQFQSATQGDLLEINLNLARNFWQNFQVEGPVQPQAITAGLRLSQDAQALVLAAPQPLEVLADVTTADGKPHALAIRLAPAARVRAQDGSAGWENLVVTLDQAELVRHGLDLKWLTPTDRPMSAQLKATYQGQLTPAAATALFGPTSARQIPSALTAQGEVAVDYDPQAVTVQTLQHRMRNGNDTVVEVQLAKALRLDPTAADFGLSRLEGTLLTKRVNQFPLALANGFLGGASLGGTVSGEGTVSAADGKVRIESREPIKASQLSYRDAQNQLLLDRVDGTVDVLAIASAQDFGFELRKLEVSTPDGVIVSGTAKASGPLTADATAPVKASGDFQANFAPLMRQPIGRAWTQPVRSTDARLTFNAEAKAAEGTATFDAQVKAGTIVVDELMALAPKPAQPANKPKPTPGTNEPAPDSSNQPATQPAWHGTTGKVSLAIDTLVKGTTDIPQVAGDIRVEPTRIVNDFGAKLEGTPIEANAVLAFLEARPDKPYQLDGRVNIQNLDVGSLLTVPGSTEKPMMEGLFSLTGQMQGGAEDLSVLPTAITGEAKMVSTKALYRPLGKYEQMGTNLSQLLGAISMISGNNTRVQEAQKILDDTLNALKEVPCDRVELDLMRDTINTFAVRTLDIQAPTLRFVGAGDVNTAGTTPLANLKMSMRGKDNVISNLEKLGASFPNKDSLGYNAIQSFDLTGPVFSPDSNLQKNITAYLTQLAKGYVTKQIQNYLPSGSSTAPATNSGTTATPPASTEDQVLQVFGSLLQNRANRQQEQKSAEEKPAEPKK